MQWDRNYSSSDIEDRRSENGAGLGGGFGLSGGGGGGAFMLIRLLSMFGWKGILVGLVIAGAVMFGGQCTHLGGSGAPAPQNQSSPATSSTSPVQQSPEEAEEVHFVGFVFDDIQRSWAKQIPDYRKAHLVLFRRGIRSACGTASTAVGPFYCQNDQKVYIDLSFYDELKTKLGAPGEFAQAYVIAHEVGHHIQKLKGLFDRGTGSVTIESRPTASPARGRRTRTTARSSTPAISIKRCTRHRRSATTRCRSKRRAMSSPRSSPTARRRNASPRSRRAGTAAPRPACKLQPYRTHRNRGLGRLGVCALLTRHATRSRRRSRSGCPCDRYRRVGMGCSQRRADGFTRVGSAARHR